MTSESTSVAAGAGDRRDYAAAVAVAPGLAEAPEATRARPKFSVRTFDSLADRSFRWFAFSMLGWFASMNMQMVVRGYLVYDLTGSYAALGVMSLANALPGLALSLPGGVMADRLRKKHVIQVGQSANMIVSAIIAVLLLTDMLVFWHLIGCAVAQGTINALIMPARQSMIPEIVSDERLMNAVALNSSGMNFMRLAAPAAGGLLYALFGPGWVYMTMAGLYGSGALFLMPVRIRPDAEQARLRARQAGAGEGETGSSLRDIIEGCRYMWRDQLVFMILIVNLLIVLVSMPFQMMLPGFVKDVLDGGAGKLGLLLSIMGGGALAGSLVIASMTERNRGRILLLSSALLGVAILAFSFSTWFWVTVPIMVVIGVGQAGRMSLSNVLIQSYTVAEYRGRVMSVYMLEFALTSFGVFFVGIISGIIGVEVAIGATAVLLIAISLGTLLFVPKMRNLQ